MNQKNKTDNTVVIVGGLLVDDIAIAAENIRPESSNPVKWQHRLGGVATNIARVVKQQINTLLIANVGDDNDGKNLALLLEKLAIPCRLVEHKDQSSDRYCAVLNASGELYVGLADAQLVEKMQWSDIKVHLPKQTPSALVLDANLSHTTLLNAVESIEEVYQEPVPIYALAVSPVKSIRLQAIAKQIDVLFCNRREAAALTSIDVHSDLAEFADGLLRAGFQNFLISDAGNPILVQEQLNRTHIDVGTMVIEQNVNGAGDAMAGAAIAQLVQGQSLVDAVAGAGLSASKAVLKGDVVPPSL